jgi:DNA-binding transcriptional regulator YdaS (Cro superfamily)
MKKKTVVKHFNTQGSIARFLGISRQAVSQWPDIIPEAAARKIEKYTDGELVVDEGLYPTVYPAQCLTEK